MSNITMIFYSNMKDIDKINSISINNSIINGYMYRSYNETIPVKIVTYYNITINEILEYLYNNNDDITFGKHRFTVDTIKAYDINNNCYKGYIIT